VLCPLLWVTLLGQGVGLGDPRGPCQPPPRWDSVIPPSPRHPLPPHLSIQVGNAAVALRGSVELSDLLNSEALGEVLPDGGSQTIAHRQPHAVLGFRLSDRLIQKIPADFPDILNNLKQQTQKHGSGFRRPLQRPRTSRPPGRRCQRASWNRTRQASSLTGRFYQFKLGFVATK